MSRIVSKKYLGMFPVFNMEVEGLHNFITSQGTVLHNCDGVRYYAISRVLPAEAQQEEKKKILYDDEDEQEEDYNTFMTGGEVTASYLVG